MPAKTKTTTKRKPATRRKPTTSGKRAPSTNPWIMFLKKFRKENPHITDFAEVTRKASAAYKKLKGK